MSKTNEINYVANVARVADVPVEEFESYLIRKPFSDQRRGGYLMDAGQILRRLPQPPARLRDTRRRFGMDIENFCLVRL
jgi:hypothetical protein